MRCQAFLKDATVPAPIIIGPDFFVVMVGSLLASQDVSSAIVMKDGKLRGAIYGYQVVKFLLEGGTEGLYQRLYSQLPQDREMIPPADIPSVTGLDQCETALAKIASHRFGDVLLTTTDYEPIGVVSLPLTVKLLSRKGRCKMKLKDVASPLKLVAGNESVSETINFMMSNRVRRVVFKRESGYYCCTEREFLRTMFSMQGLQMIKDDPESLLSQKVETIAMSRASQIPTLDGSRRVEEAWEICANVPLVTAIVNDDMIATPWDLVVKPYIERKLEFA